MIWILIYTKRFNTYENKKIKDIITEESRYHNFKILDPGKIYSVIENNKQTIYYYKGELIPEPKKVYLKTGCMINDHIKELFQTFSPEVKIINNFEEIELVANKFLNINNLIKYNIPTIKTLKLVGFNPNYLNIIQQNFCYPLILKSTVGSLGIGIYKIKDNQELKNHIDQINLLDEKFNYLIQEYIEQGNIDYRVVVYGGKIEYIMQRTSKNNEFRSNYSLGSTIKLVNKNQKIEALVKSIYEVIPLNIMGIDLIKKENNYLVCEINTNPGFLGIDTINETKSKTFAYNLLDYLNAF